MNAILPRTRFLFLAALAVAASAAPSQAQTFNQLAGGTFAWNTPAFWTPATVPGGLAGDIATFNGITVATTVNLDDGAIAFSPVLGQLVFNTNTAAITIAPGAGGAISFDNSGVASVISVATGNTVSITAGVSVAAVGLNVANNGTLGLGALNNGGFALNFNGSGATTVNGLLSGSGLVTYNGTGLLAFNGNNSNSGGLSVASGTVALTFANTNTAAGTAAVTLSGGTLSLAGTASTTPGLSQRLIASAGSDTARNNFTATATNVGVRSDFGAGNIPVTGGDIATINAIQYRGNLQIATGGSYTFRIASDDGTRLFIDGVMIIQNDGGKGVTYAQSGTINLTAGLHDIRYDFVNSGGGGGLYLGYAGPDQPVMSVVPASRIFVAETNTLGSSNTAVILGAGIGNDFNVTGTSTVLLNATATTAPTVQVGNATFANGTTLNLTSTTGFQARGLRIGGNADFGATVNLALTGDGTNGANLFFDGIAGSAVASTITKTGPGTLTFTQTTASSTFAAGSAINVQAGTLQLVGIINGNNPIGTAAINLNGGNLILDSKAGGTAFGVATQTNFDNAITTSANATIQVISNASFTGLGGSIAIASGTTLTIDAIAGGSPLTSLGAQVNLTGALTGDATTVLQLRSSRISGGFLNIVPASGVVAFNGNLAGFSGNIAVGSFYTLQTTPNTFFNGRTIFLNGGTLNNYLSDFDGTGAMQSAAAAATSPIVVQAAGGFLTVGRLGAGLPAPLFLTPANKTVQISNFSTLGGNFSVNNNNGYGLEITNGFTLTATTGFGATNASFSNLVPGLTLSGAIGGGFGITKTGLGTVALTNAGNTFGGAGTFIDVLGGVVGASSDGALGDAATAIRLNGTSSSTGETFTGTNALIVGSTANLFPGMSVTGTGIPANATIAAIYNGTTVYLSANTTATGTGVAVTFSTTAGFEALGTFSTARTFTFSNATNTNNVILVSTGNTLTLTTGLTLTNGFQKSNPGVLQLTAAGTGSAAVTVSGGILRLQNAAALGTAPVNVVGNVSTALQIDGTLGTIANAITINGTGLNSGGSLQNLSGTNVVSSVAMASAAAIGADAGSNLTVSSLSGAFNATLLGAGTGTISNTTSSGTVVKLGTGSWTIAGGTTLTTAAMQVLNGTLTFSGNTALVGTGTPVLSPAGTLVLDNTGTNINNRLNGRFSNMWFSGELRILGNATVDTSESTGGATNFTPAGAQGIVTLVPGTGRNVTFGSGTTFPISRGAPSTLLFRGNNLGTGGPTDTATIRFSNITVASFAGQQGLAGTANRGILAWGLADISPTGNGTAFATYDTVGTNGIRPLGQVAGETVATLTSLTNVSAISTLVSSLPSFTVNSLTLNSGGGVTIAPASTLLLDSGGVLALASNTGISGGANSILAGTAAKEVIIHTPGAGSTLALTANLTGTGGLVKTSLGSLTLTGRSFITGNQSVNGGTLQLNGGNNTLLPGQVLNLSFGGTLDLNGTSQLTGTFQSPATGGLEAVQAGGVLTNTTASPSTLLANVAALTANTRFAGTTTATNISFAKSGGATGFTLLLSNPMLHTGSTLVMGGGNATTIGGLTLLDNAVLANTSSVGLNYGSLLLDNTGLVNNNDRLNNSAPIEMRGGMLSFQGRAQTASTESVGVVTLAQGASNLNVTAGGTGLNSAVLTLADLARSADATLNLNGASGQLGSTARLIITTRESAPGLVNNIMGGWAVNGGSDFLSYVPTLGVAALNAAGYAGYDATAIASSNNPTFNVKLAATAALPATGANINSLAINGAFNVTFAAATDVLNITSGGLLKSSNNTTTIGAVLDSGMLTVGGAGASGTQNLYIHINSAAANTLTINSRIIDNGSAPVRLVFTPYNGGTLVLPNNLNSYTGGTVLNAWTQAPGTISVTAAGAVPAGGLTINGGTVSVTVAGGVASANAVTINGGGILTLTGANTLQGLTFNNSGGLVTPAVNSGGVLTVGAGGINATSSNPFTTATIAGTLDLNGSQTFTVAPVTVNGVTNIAPYNASLNVTAIVQNGTLVKAGDGNLQLGATTSTFAGGVNLTAGGIILAASSTPTTGAVTSGPLGTGTLSAASGTTILSTATVTLANALSIGGNLNFSGLNSITFNGAVALPASPLNIDVNGPAQVVTLNGTIVSNPGTAITKTGLGTLVFGAGYTGVLSLPAGGSLGLVSDGDGFGTPNTIPFNVTSGGALALTVGRSGVTYFPYRTTASNKILQLNGLDLAGYGLTVTNNNGYGAELTANQSLTATEWGVSVATATNSNVTQGATVSGVVSGAGGIFKIGAGALILTNAGNSFGGAGKLIDIQAGIVGASSDGALGNAANGVRININAATAAGFRASGTFSTARTFTLNQAANAIEVTGGNTLTLNSAFSLATVSNALAKNDLGILELTATNSTWTGATTINQGAVRATGANAAILGSGVVNIANSGGSALQLSSVSIANAITLAATQSGINSGGGIQAVAGTSTTTGLITQTSGFASFIGVDSGAVWNLNGGYSSVNSVNVMVSGTGILNVNTTALAITGGNPFSKFGAGTLNITTNNTAMVTSVAVNAGTLTYSGAGVAGTAANAVTLNPGGTLNLDSTGTVTTNRLGGKAIIFVAGTLNLLGGVTVTNEALAAPTFNRGQTTITVTDGGAGTNLSFTAASNNPGALQSAGPSAATALFRGTSLGTLAGLGISTIQSTAGGFLFAGQLGATGATSKGILPWAIIDTTAGGLGTSFATGDAAAAATNTVAILRPLAAGEYGSGALAANQNMLVTTALTAQPTVAPNSLTIDTGGSIALGSSITGIGNTLTLSSGGILVRNGVTSTISGGLLSAPGGGTPLNIHTPGSAQLTISSTVTGGSQNDRVGFVKAGGGTLILGTPTLSFGGLTTYSANTINWQTVVNQGTLRLNGGTNTLGANNFLAVTPGGTLDLNGSSQYVLGLFTDGTVTGVNGAPAGGTINNSAVGQARLVTNSDARNWAGTITGNVFYNRTGSLTTTTIYTPQTYTGGTLINGGTVSLRDYATLSATSAIDIQFGTLQLDNTGTNDLAGRLNAAAPITMRGSTFIYLGRAQTASAETVGAISLVEGWNVIDSRTGGTGINSAVLTAATLSRPVGSTAVVHFGQISGTTDQNGQIGSTGRLVFSSAPTLSNDLIGPWAVVTREWASYIPTLGVGQLNANGFAGYAPTNLTTGSATENIRLTAAPAVLTANSTVNTLNLITGGTAAVDLGGFRLTLAGGGLLNSTVAGTQTFSNGTITSGLSGGDLYIHHLPYAGASRFMVISAGIVDNGGQAVRLVLSHSDSAVAALTVSGTLQTTNVVVFSGNNTYTGGTVFNGGTVIVANGASLPGGGITLNATHLGEAFGNTVGNANVAGTINSANVVTLNGPSVLSLANDSTLAGLVFNNTGATTSGSATQVNLNPTVNTFIAGMGTAGLGTLTIGASGILATSSNVATTSIIVGRIDSGALPTTFNIAPITVNGAAVAPLQATLAIQGWTGSAGTITKSGTGVLQINGQQNFTGILNVTAGGINIGLASATGLAGNSQGGSRNSALVLDANTWLNLLNTDAAIGSIAGSGTIFNQVAFGAAASARTLTVGFDNTNTTFSGSIARYSDQLAATIQLNKIGSGTLTLTGSSNSTSTLQVSQGGVTYSGAGTSLFGTHIVYPTGLLTLDNSGTNVNNRLGGTTTTGTISLSGGGLRITGNASDATTETIGTLNYGATNPFGTTTITLVADPAQPLTLTVGTTFVVNNNGASGLIRGVSGTAGAGFANLSIGALALGAPAGVGTGANGTFTMPVRSDLIGDTSATGFGTAFITKDSATNFLRPLAAGEMASSFLPGSTNTTVNYGLSTAAALYGPTTIIGSTVLQSGGSMLLASGISNVQRDGLPMTLNVNTGGILALTGNNGISIGRITTANNVSVFFHTVGNLTVDGVVAGTSGGIVKADGGTLTLTDRQLYTGNTLVNGGTLVLAGGQNTLAILQTAGVPTATGIGLNAGTIDLNGNSQISSALFTSGNGGARYNGNSGTITNTSATAATYTLNQSAALAVGAAITGNLSFIRTGNNALTFASPLTYSGTTTLQASTTTLIDAATLANTSAINLNYAILNVDQSGLNPTGNNNPQRTPAAAPINLRGGGYTFTPGGSADYTQTINTMNVLQSHNTITVPQAPVGGSGALTIGNLVVNADATINLSGGTGGFFSNLPGMNQSQLFITSINGTAIPVTISGKILGGNILANNGEFVTYVQSGTTGSNNINYGVVTLNGTTGPLAAITQTAYDATVITGAGTVTTNVRLGASGTLVSGGTTYNSLALRAASLTVNFTNAADILTLASGGLALTGGTAATIGTAAIPGVLTSGFVPSGDTVARLYIHSSVGTVNSIIANNGATPVRLIANSFAGTLTLAGANTYTGGTVVGGGSTVAVATTGLIPVGGITINNSTLTASAAASLIASTNDVTINGGGVLTLGAFANTLNSLTFNNNGGTATPTVTGSTVSLTLTSSNPITSVNDNLATVPTITGTSIILSNAAPTITTSTTANVPTNLAITGIITSTGGALNKAGSGSLFLSGVNTFSAGVNLNAGAIILGNNAALGSGTITMAGGTALLSDTAVRTITNSVVLTGDVTFGSTAGNSFAGTVAVNGVILNGTVDLGAAFTRTINVNSYLNTSTIGGIVSGFGSSLVKTGPGVLVLTGANSYDNGTAINGGVLQSNSTGLGSSGTISFGGGILQHAAITTTDFSARFSTANNQPIYIDTNSQTITYASALTSSTGGSLGKFGAGTLILTNTAVYDGITLINQGTLQIGATVDAGSATGLLPVNTPILNAGVLLVNKSTNDTLAGIISGAGSITKLGSGNLTLTGVNTFTGNVSINGATPVQAGTLTITNSSALGIGPKTITVISNHAISNGTLALDGSGGSINLAQNISFNTSSTTGNGGILNVAGDNTIAGNFTLTGGGGNTQLTSSGGTLSVLAGAIMQPNAAGRILVLNGTSAGANTIGAVIQDNGANLLGVTKNGPGLWVLTGTNTYTQATAVNAGELRVNGTNTATAGTFTVSTGATLAGNGSIASQANVSGTIQGGVGAGTGTLTTRNVDIASAGILSANLGLSGTASKLDIGSLGTLNFATTGSVLKLNPAGFDPLMNGTWVIATSTTGNYSIGGFANIQPDTTEFGKYIQGGPATGAVTFDVSGLTLAATDTFTLSRQSNDLVLNFASSAVPEPGTILGLAAAGMGLAVWVRRRRNAKASV